MRTKIVAGNWKMNKTPSEAGALIAGIRAATNDGDCGVEVVVCVPFTDIPAAAEALKGSKIGLGAQNMHWKESGAYTGEISAAMLKDLGVRYVILGHSERRQYFAETDDSADLAGCQEDFDRIVIAYEPVWAIGTGKTATSTQAQEVHALIRATLAKMNPDKADDVRIQYGGSMKPENAADLMAKPDIDGGLIGGAALKADSFAAIVAAGK